MARRRRSHRRHYRGLGRARRSYRSYGRRHGRRRSRRGFRGFAELPSLATLKANVNGKDALMGAGLGLLGVFAVNKYIHDQKDQKVAAAIAADPWKGAMYGLIGPVLAGIAGYMIFGKGNVARAQAWIVGAAGAGIAVAGTRLLDAGYISKTAYFAQPVKSDAGLLPAGATSGYGLLMRRNGMQSMGLLTADPGKRRAAGLARLSMALDEANVAAGGIGQ